MNKTELIEAIATHVGSTKADAAQHADAFLVQITEALQKGDQVTIPGFGTFKVSQRAARQGRNPRTGEVLNIAAARVPKFSAGKNLKEAVQAN